MNLLETLALHCIFVAFPMITHLDGVRVDEFEFGLDNTFGLLVIRFFIKFLVDLGLRFSETILFLFLN